MDPLAIFILVLAGIAVLCTLVSAVAVGLHNAKGDG